jgi:hypothetical protein
MTGISLFLMKKYPGASTIFAKQHPIFRNLLEIQSCGFLHSIRHIQSYKTQLLNFVLNIANTDLFDFIEYKCASSNVLKDTTRQTLYLYFGDSPKGSLLENELNMTDAVPA